MVHWLLKMTSVLDVLVSKDGLAGMNLVQRDGLFLYHFDWDRLGRRKVPYLLAFGLCLVEDRGNRGSVNVSLSLAQMETLGNDFRDTLTGRLSVQEEGRIGVYH
jgi:hypothetical protein